MPLLTGLEDSTHACSSLDITVPFCRCLRRRPLIGGPPKRKVRSLYTALQKAYYALEHLDDLFRPLLFSLRAAMHVKLLNVPHLLQLAQVALLIVHRFSSRCCTNIASSIMCCCPSSWSNCSTRLGSSGGSVGSLLPNRFAGWASCSVSYWSLPKSSKLQVQKSYKTCLLSWGLWRAS